MKKILLSVFLLTLTSSSMMAQGVHPVTGEPLKYCGTDEATRKLYESNPGLKELADIIEEQQKNNPPSTNELPPVYTIPVVVHILHNYGPENIPDANVKDAVNILTRDFRKQNADTAIVAAPFKTNIADCEIEFKLAQLDPNGNCTNGIDRIVTNETYIGDDGSKLNQWPRDKYLNIWVVNTISSGAAGYAYFPSGAASNPAVDGIVILYTYFSSLSPSSVGTSRALTHEVGHYLNLYHTWGSGTVGTSCSGTDNVSDTPTTMGWSPGNCPLTGNDICVPGVAENVQNYMEYAYCQVMFTNGQRSRMRTALNSSVSSRNNLWTTGNLAFTGVSGSPALCTADFKVSKTVICVGTSITFTDLSWNTTPTSWQWDVDNDGNTDYTTQNPLHTYSTPGLKTVKLTVSDGVSTKTTTKTNYIVVLNNTASTVAPFSEGFETSGFPYSDWYKTQMNSSTTDWNRVTTAAYTGSSSLKLDNYSQTSGDIDEFITPSIDFSSVNGQTMTFRLAQAQRNSTDDDKLRVLTSSNCGVTWVQRYSKTGATLATAGVVGSAFTPASSSQWRQETVSISNITGQPNVRIKFEFTSDGSGNNAYIDDINITGVSTTGIENEIANDFSFSVFPNPVDETTTISFTLETNHTVSVGIYDIVGKEIVPATNSELSAGTYEFPVNSSVLKPGVYFVKLNADNYSAVKKVIVH